MIWIDVHSDSLPVEEQQSVKTMGPITVGQQQPLDWPAVPLPGGVLPGLPAGGLLPGFPPDADEL